nr:DUF1661 domain-containing protein [Porphyromonas gulae]
MLRAGTKKISRHYCRKHRPELEHFRFVLP